MLMRRRTRIRGPRERNALAEQLVAAGLSLHLDAVTTEVVLALREAGIPSVLLRGPAIAQWLYEEATERSYVDVDLLIPYDVVQAAEKYLSGLGFSDLTVEGVLPHDRPTYAHTWARRRDGATVDVHYTLLGAQLEPKLVWEVLAGETEATSLEGAAVRILTKPGRALVVALHAAHHGVLVGKPLDDLARALELLPAEVWEQASALAARLEATSAFATGLSLLPPGEAVARRLGLPDERSTETVLRASTPPPMALGFDWLASTPGPRAKLGLVTRKIVPAPAFMRARSPLARRGRVGLAVAYVWRVLWLARHASPGFRAWRRARRAAR
jgi:hypothetical protein